MSRAGRAQPAGAMQALRTADQQTTVGYAAGDGASQPAAPSRSCPAAETSRGDEAPLCRSALPHSAERRSAQPTPINSSQHFEGGSNRSTRRRGNDTTREDQKTVRDGRCAYRARCRAHRPRPCRWALALLWRLGRGPRGTAQEAHAAAGAAPHETFVSARTPSGFIHMRAASCLSEISV